MAVKDKKSEAQDKGDKISRPESLIQKMHNDSDSELQQEVIIPCNYFKK